MKLYQIEGMPTFEGFKKNHPFTFTALLGETESMIAMVGPDADSQTWTAMVCVKKEEDTKTWSTKAFVWCHMEPMEVLYEKWGVGVIPPFQWDQMKQAPGRGLEWMIEEKGSKMDEALDKTLRDIAKCRMGAHMALAYLQQEANRLQASSIGPN